jgi:hypothetical protein
VRHWRDTKSGGYKLKDERDIYELCANQAQRRLRACILASIPGDVTEAAMNQAETSLKAKADTSPEAMAKMLEAFAPFGVTKEHVEKRIQRRLDAITPAQVVSLKRIYASLRDDMSTPAEWFDMGEPAVSAETTASLDKVRQTAAAKKTTPAAKTASKSLLPEYTAKMEGATGAETAMLLLDEARDLLNAEDMAALSAAFEAKFPGA